jgi:hypothetical protein
MSTRHATNANALDPTVNIGPVFGFLPGASYAVYPSQNVGVLKGNFRSVRDGVLDQWSFYVESNQGVTGQQVAAALAADGGNGGPGKTIAYLGYYDSGGSVPTTGIKNITISQPIKRFRQYWLIFSPLTDKWAIRGGGGGGGSYSGGFPCDSGNPTICASLARDVSDLDTTGAPADFTGSWFATDATYTPVLRMT